MPFLPSQISHHMMWSPSSKQTHQEMIALQLNCFSQRASTTALHSKHTIVSLLRRRSEGLHHFPFNCLAAPLRKGLLRWALSQIYYWTNNCNLNRSTELTDHGLHQFSWSWRLQQCLESTELTKEPREPSYRTWKKCFSAYVKFIIIQTTFGGVFCKWREWARSRIRWGDILLILKCLETGFCEYSPHLYFNPSPRNKLVIYVVWITPIKINTEENIPLLFSSSFPCILFA